MLERIWQSPYAAVEDDFLPMGAHFLRLTHTPHEKLMVSLSTKADRLRQTWAIDRLLASPVGCTCKKAPPVLMGLSGPLGESVRQKRPAMALVRRHGHTVRALVNLGV